jgi:hypothetical protein
VFLRPASVAASGANQGFSLAAGTTYTDGASADDWYGIAERFGRGRRHQGHVTGGAMSIAGHIDRMLSERRDGRNVAERVARVIVAARSRLLSMPHQANQATRGAAVEASVDGLPGLGRRRWEALQPALAGRLERVV